MFSIRLASIYHYRFLIRLEFEGAQVPDNPLLENTQPLTSREDKELTYISRAGWILFVIWAAVLIMWGYLQPNPYAEGWRLVLELLFLGRLVNIADGMSTGFSQEYLFIQSAPEDVILLLIMYPIIVRAYHGAVRRKWISGAINRVRKSAERNKNIVEPFGVIGLWIFVFFPFWRTGSLVGGVVGYLLGLRTWLTFASVLTGHIISVISLIWFFDTMNEFLIAFNEGVIRFLPWIVIGILILISLLLRMYKTVRHPHPDRGDNQEPDEDAG